MNILFTNKNSFIFDNLQVEELAKFFEFLEKFKVKSLTNYLEVKMNIIQNALPLLDIKSHFKLLYVAMKTGNFLAINKHPLMVSFLLKLKQGEINQNFQNNMIQLAWVLLYFSNKELEMNGITENILIKLIDFLSKEVNWINFENVDQLLEIVMMIDNLKSNNININRTVLGYFDKKNILNLMNYHLYYSKDFRAHSKILRLFENQKIFEFIQNKNTNIFYIDFVVKFFQKVFLIMFSYLTYK